MTEDSSNAIALKGRFRLLVKGVVQGVGFRPFVYRLARRHNLTGFVLNSPDGATIEVEGDRQALDLFLQELPANGPPLMHINGIQASEAAIEGDLEFVIRESAAGPNAFTFVPADVCVCDPCLAETRDPMNRRHTYPFTNCTNCGPRYSIILDVPYDRSQTTMAPFTMCDNCRREYDDPSDRRFHAQPNACPVCGPKLELSATGGAAGGADLSAQAVLNAAVQLLQEGGIVAWKGLGGYQLACDARQPAAVAELRRRKHRSEKPFAVMVGELAVAEAICLISPAERVVLLSPERPIVLLQRRIDAGLAEDVSPDNPMTGLMLPCTPMHDLLFRVFREKGVTDAALVMTSGNVSDEPIVIENAEAEQRLANVADLFVHHNRGIHTRVDDSIVRVVDELPMLLRRARGYAPSPLWLGLGDAEVLACGAQQKSTLCLTRAGFALPSQHLGDLENYETLEFFEQTLARMRLLFHANPRIIAHDLHPGYLSTQLAIKMEADQFIAIQHHHAHIASCMAEHQLRGQVIGVAWDGTGLGTDGAIWGGEFLVADLAGFERYAHLRNELLAGGDAAVREPWRVARSYLRDTFGNATPKSAAFPAEVPEERMALLDAMLERRVQTIETSSCGRLFDAVASLIGLRHTVSFEGQAAMMLEAIAVSDDAGLYEFAVEGRDPPQCPTPPSACQIDLRPMIRQIVHDLDEGISGSRIATRFHNTLVAVVSHVCQRIRSELGLSRVCLSGGCFQNLTLLRGCVRTLRAENFEVFFQRKVPANDGGISLGQAAIACELAARNPNQR